MFQSSTQKKFWLMENPEAIAELQMSSNKLYIENFTKLCNDNGMEVVEEFLAYHEEKLLLIHFSHHVIDICQRFKPSVPMSVIGISLTYFKRFYLKTSVMEYHPRDIAYLCVYLACKVDEYNVSIDQFIQQTRPENPISMEMFIIDNELLLLQKLDFHLTIHTSYRPLEGFIIDLKTCQQAVGIKHVESFRATLEKFLMNSLLTDVCLLHPPSQIALSALYHAIGKPFLKYLELRMDRKHVKTIVHNLEEIKEIAMNFKKPTELEIDLIEEKLKVCFDYENDPVSEMYCARKNAHKQLKEIEKKRKYKELCDMQDAEQRVLAADMSMS